MSNLGSLESHRDYIRCQFFVIHDIVHAQLSTLFILTAQTFSSGILAIGSRAGFVRTLVGASEKWNVMKITPWGDLSVTFAFALTRPRRDETSTKSPSS